MKNRIIAVLLIIALLATAILPLCVSANYAIPDADGGGFDFHSLTIYYDQPTVVQYKSVTAQESKEQELIPTYSQSGKLTYTAGYIFAEPEETRVVRAGDSLGQKGTAYNLYKSAVQESGGYRGNFEGMTGGVEGKTHTTDLYYSTFPNEYGYLTNIHDNDLIQTSDPVSLRGVTEIVDDAGTKNPNIEFGADGYAIDANGGRIDDNGYLLDEHDNWYKIDTKGEKEILQLFKFCNDEVVPMSRYGADGRIIKISQFDGAMVYVVDENGEIALDSKGNQRRGTPDLGTPVMKTHITKITVDIDALGTALSGDPAADPQQKNTITVSIGNCLENIETIPACGQILGTAKAVTTKTSVAWDKKTAGDTVTGCPLEITQEQLDAISPNSAKIWILFNVQQIQGVDAYSKKYTMENSYDSGLKKAEISLLTEADAENYATPGKKDDKGGFFGSLLFWILLGVLVLIIAGLVVMFILLKKVKKNNAAKAAAGNTAQTLYEPQYYTDENGVNYYSDEYGNQYYYDAVSSQWILYNAVPAQEEAPAEETAPENTADQSGYFTDENGINYYLDENGYYYYYDNETQQWLPCDTSSQETAVEENNAAANTENQYFIDDQGNQYYFDSETQQYYPVDLSEQPAPQENTEPLQEEYAYETAQQPEANLQPEQPAYEQQQQQPYADPYSQQFYGYQQPMYGMPQQPQMPYGYQQPMYAVPPQGYYDPNAGQFYGYQQPMYGMPQQAQQPEQPAYDQQQQQPYADPNAQQFYGYQQPMYGMPYGYQQPMYGMPQQGQMPYGYQQPMYQYQQYPQYPQYGQQPMQPQQQPMYYNGYVENGYVYQDGNWYPVQQ